MLVNFSPNVSTPIYAKNCRINDSRATQFSLHRKWDATGNFLLSGTVNLLSCQSPSTPLVSTRVTLPSFRVTRCVNNLNIPCCRLATGQHRFAYRWVKIWNGLRKHLRTLTSYDNFKRCIFREYLSKSC